MVKNIAMLISIFKASTLKYLLKLHITSLILGSTVKYLSFHCQHDQVEEKINLTYKDLRFSGCNDNITIDFAMDNLDSLVLENQPIQSEVDKMLPRVIHCLWPSRKQFTFKHFLSFKSIVKYLQPHKFVVHFSICSADEEPVPEMDPSSYNHYWEELVSRVTILIVKQDIGCFYDKSDQESMERLIGNAISTEGGFYVSEDIIFSERFVTSYIRINPEDKSIYFKSTPRLEIALAYGREKSNRKWIQNGSCDECINVKDTIFPYQIWKGNGRLAKTARNLFYHNSNVIQVNKSPEKIPLICHYAVISYGDVQFAFFISAISCLSVLK